jgi:hypothetical protein
MMIDDKVLLLEKTKTFATIGSAIKNVQRLYAARGFRVKHGHVDNEFEPLRGDLLDIGVHLNVVSNNEHVP